MIDQQNFRVSALNFFRLQCQSYSIDLIGVNLDTRINCSGQHIGELTLIIECDDAQKLFCESHCQLAMAASEVGFTRIIWKDTSGELIASFRSETLLNTEECQFKLNQHSPN